jgi:hypothetical protein
MIQACLSNAKQSMVSIALRFLGGPIQTVEWRGRRVNSRLLFSNVAVGERVGFVVRQKEAFFIENDRKMTGTVFLRH